MIWWNLNHLSNVQTKQMKKKNRRKRKHKKKEMREEPFEWCIHNCWRQRRRNRNNREHHHRGKPALSLSGVWTRDSKIGREKRSIEMVEDVNLKTQGLRVCMCEWGRERTFERFHWVSWDGIEGSGHPWWWRHAGWNRMTSILFRLPFSNDVSFFPHIPVQCPLHWDRCMIVCPRARAL